MKIYQRRRIGRRRSTTRKPKLKLLLLLKLMETVARFDSFREAFIGALVAVILAFGEALGLEQVTQLVIAFVGGSYATAAGIAEINIKKRFETASRKLRSKKFRYTLLTIFLTVLADKLGYPGFAEIALGIIGSFLNIGQGIKDLGDRDGGDGVVEEGPVLPVEAAPQFKSGWEGAGEASVEELKRMLEEVE